MAGIRGPFARKNRLAGPVFALDPGASTSARKIGGTRSRFAPNVVLPRSKRVPKSGRSSSRSALSLGAIGGVPDIGRSAHFACQRRGMAAL